MRSGFDARSKTVIRGGKGVLTRGYLKSGRSGGKLVILTVTGEDVSHGRFQSTTRKKAVSHGTPPRAAAPPETRRSAAASALDRCRDSLPLRPRSVPRRIAYQLNSAETPLMVNETNSATRNRGVPRDQCSHIFDALK